MVRLDCIFALTGRPDACSAGLTDRRAGFGAVGDNTRGISYGEDRSVRLGGWQV